MPIAPKTLQTRFRVPLRSKVYGYILAGLATAGLVDSTLLTQEHYSDIILPCSVTQGCETVLNSKYSEVFGIPLAVLGLVFYFSVLLATLYFVQSGRDWLKKLLLAMGVVGFVSSLGLVYIQGVVIKAWCQYCLISALSSTLIFVFAALLYTTKKEKPHEEA